MKTKHRLMTIGGLAMSVGSVVAGSAITSGAIGGTDPTSVKQVTMTSVSPDPDGDGMIACTTTVDAADLPEPVQGVPGVVTATGVDGGAPEGGTIVSAEGPSFSVGGADGAGPTFHVGGTPPSPGALEAGAVFASVAMGPDGEVTYSGDVREGTAEECAAVELPPVPPIGSAGATTEG